MAITVEEFVAKIGWDVDPKGLKQFQKQVGEIGDSVKKAAKWGAGLATALGVFVVMQNKQTAALLNTAKAYDINAEALENYSMLLGDIGVEGQGVAQMMVNLGNKTAAVANKLPGGERIKKAFAAMGLDTTKLSGMSQQGRFESVLERLRTMENQSKALALGEKLLGGDGAKVVGYLRAGKVSIQELVAGVSELNLQTAEGRKGAMEFFTVWDDLADSFESFRMLVAGMLGKALAPMLEQLKTWVVANKGLIQSKVAEWTKKIALGAKQLGLFLYDVASAANTVATAFGGWVSVFKILLGMRLITWARDLGKAIAPMAGGRLFAGVAATAAIPATGAAPAVAAQAAKSPLLSSAIVPLVGVLVGAVVDGFKAFSGKPEESSIAQGWQNLWDFSIAQAFGIEADYATERKRLLAAGVSKELVDTEFTYDRYFAARKNGLLMAAEKQANFVSDKLSEILGTVGTASANAAGAISNFFSTLGNTISTSIFGMFVRIAQALQGVPIVGEIFRPLLGMKAGVEAANAERNMPFVGPRILIKGQPTNDTSYMSGGRSGPFKANLPAAGTGINTTVNINMGANADPAAVGREVERGVNRAAQSVSRNANKGVQR